MILDKYDSTGNKSINTNVKLNELLRVPFDFCIPSIPVTYTYVPCTDKDGNENRILLMHIPASSSLHTNQADEAFMRVGDKSRKLTFDERVQLMYDKGERSFEDTAVYGSSIEDIDMDAVARYVHLLEYSKSPLAYLRENNHFVTTNKNGEEVISVACMLLFGKDPQLFSHVLVHIGFTSFTIGITVVSVSGITPIPFGKTVKPVKLGESTQVSPKVAG